MMGGEHRLVCYCPKNFKEHLSRNSAGLPSCRAQLQLPRPLMILGSIESQHHWRA